VTPNDTAVLSGQSAVLHCHTDWGLSTYVYWNLRTKDMDIGRFKNIVSRCSLIAEVSSQFPPVYSLISDVAGQCDLVISSVDRSVTGFYRCGDVNYAWNAHLTIIGQFFCCCANSLTFCRRL